MANVLKNTEAELELLTDIDMLYMVQKDIRGGICHAIHRYTTANNKYMKEYNKGNEWPYIMYWDANNLYGWEISQNLPVDGFEWKKNTSKFNEKFIKNYKKDSDIEDILEVGVEYPKRLYNLHNNLPFLPIKMKIKKCHIRTLKQALDHGLIF